MRKIYAIDDSPQIRTYFRRTIEGLAEMTPLLISISKEDDAMQAIADFECADEFPIFFLDLNLTDNESGFRILAAIRNRRELEFVPVIILSNSDDKSSIDRCYELGANAYHIKSSKPKFLRDHINKMIRYWLSNVDSSISTLPNPATQ